MVPDEAVAERRQFLELLKTNGESSAHHYATAKYREYITCFPGHF
jgi:hypothetical protein